MSDGTNERLKVRSLVGVIPMFAVEIMNIDLFKELKEFQKRANEIIRTRPDLASLISNLENANKDGNFLFSIMRGFRLEHLLKRLLDENSFQITNSSLSKYHKDHPLFW
jgi:hypothetical protein